MRVFAFFETKIIHTPIEKVQLIILHFINTQKARYFDFSKRRMLRFLSKVDQLKNGYMNKMFNYVDKFIFKLLSKI